MGGRLLVSRPCFSLEIYSHTRFVLKQHLCLIHKYMKAVQFIGTDKSPVPGN